jgi:hypothetical protein
MHFIRLNAGFKKGLVMEKNAIESNTAETGRVKNIERLPLE